MKKILAIAAAVMMVVMGSASAATVASRPSASFSSSRSFSTSSSYSRSYTPARAYGGTTRVYRPYKATPSFSRSVMTRSTVVNNTTVVHNTAVVHHYPSYSFYHPMAAYPVYVHNYYAFDAFNAILAWQMLSAAQRAATPMPPAADLSGLSYEELCRAIWADGKMTLAEVQVLNQWKAVHAGVH